MSNTLIVVLVLIVVVAIAIIWGGPGKGWMKKVWYKKSDDLK